MSLAGSAPRLVVLVRIGTDPVLRLSTAFGDFPVGINALDDEETIYQSLGGLESLPSIQAMLNGQADRVAFSLSGVPAEIAALAEADAPNVQGAAVNLGLVLLDEDWAIDGDVFWLWDGEADKLTAAKSMGDDGDESHAISLSVATAHAARSRPEFAFWTDAQHQRSHPGDLFLSLLPSGEKEKRWPV